MQIQYCLSHAGNVWAGIFFSRFNSATETYLGVGFGAFFSFSGKMLSQPSELRDCDSWVFQAPRLSHQPVSIPASVLSIATGLQGPRCNRKIATVDFLRLGENYYIATGDFTTFQHASNQPDWWMQGWERATLPRVAARIKSVRPNLPDWFGAASDGDCWRESVVLPAPTRKGGDRRGRR